MKTKISILVVSALVLGSVVELAAHHGTGISYDLTRNPITLKGTVTEFRWSNPHVSVFMDVRDESGKVVNWALEGAGIPAYLTRGFSRNTLKVGMEVTALAYPSKIKGTPAAVIAKITLPDGKEVLRFQSDTPGQRGNNE